MSKLLEPLYTRYIALEQQDGTGIELSSIQQDTDHKLAKALYEVVVSMWCKGIDFGLIKAMLLSTDQVRFSGVKNKYYDGSNNKDDTIMFLCSGESSVIIETKHGSNDAGYYNVFNSADIHSPSPRLLDYMSENTPFDVSIYEDDVKDSWYGYDKPDDDEDDNYYEDKDFDSEDNISQDDLDEIARQADEQAPRVANINPGIPHRGLSDSPITPKGLVDELDDTNRINNASEKVNHPDHYQHIKIGHQEQDEQKFEAIDIIEGILNSLDLDGTSSWHLGNTLKYVLRAPFKDNPVEDFQKGEFYFSRLIQHEQNKDNDASAFNPTAGTLDANDPRFHNLGDDDE